MEKMMKIIAVILSQHNGKLNNKELTFGIIKSNHRLLEDYGMDILDKLELEFTLEAVLAKYTKNHNVSNIELNTVSDVAELIKQRLSIRVSN